MKLPGYPTTERAWLDLVKRDGWPFREVKSKGRGGIRREYQPPVDMQALILLHKLATLFAQYRETLKPTMTMAAAVEEFVREYNKPDSPFQRVEGFGSVDSDMVGAAIQGRPVSASQHVADAVIGPQFAARLRETKDRAWINSNLLATCLEAVEELLEAKQAKASTAWRLSTAFFAYNYIGDINNLDLYDPLALKRLEKDDYLAAARLAFVSRFDEEVAIQDGLLLVNSIPITEPTSRVLDDLRQLSRKK